MSKRYEILNQDGTTLKVEGELVLRDGKRFILDGQGKPWLLLLEHDVLKPMNEKTKIRRADGSSGEVPVRYPKRL